MSERDEQLTPNAPFVIQSGREIREQFGPLVGKHYEAGRGKKRSNIPERIRPLVRSLFGPDAIHGDAVIKPYADLRYQLLTALAGTLIEARRRFVDQAVLLVHEFTSRSGPGGYVGTNKAGLARNADDWAAFIRALHSSPADGGGLVGPLFVPGCELVPAEMPFFLGKATCPLGDDAARRWLADRAGPAAGKPPTAPPLDPSITVGRSYASDLERIRKAREAAAASGTHVGNRRLGFCWSACPPEKVVDGHG